MPDTFMQKIIDTLSEFNLNQEDYEDIYQSILSIQAELQERVSETNNSIPLRVLLAQSADATQMIEMMTDYIIEKEGLLDKAMKGEDIYDSLACIKAKIESLVVGEDIEARTLSNITKRMRIMHPKDVEDSNA